MKNVVIVIFVAVISLAAGVGGGYWYGRRAVTPSSAGAHEPEGSQTEEPSAADSAPVVPVKACPIRKGSLAARINAYGSVVAEAGEIKIISVPFESRIKHLTGIPGELVAAGATLVEVEPSPDTALQAKEARNAVTAATRDLQQTQQRFDQKLATNQELFQSQQVLESAKLKLESLEQRGAINAVPLKADMSGVIGKISVQEGQIVPAGGPLMEIAPEHRIEVQLGIGPENVCSLHIDQGVDLSPLRAVSKTVKGHIRMITHKINPETRLVDVYVALPPDAGFILDEGVRAVIATDATPGLVVPRAAVIPGEAGYMIFTADGGRAVKHDVQLGLDDGTDIHVKGAAMHEGQLVIIEGNYELEDGMAVEVKSSAAASTRPAPQKQANASPDAKALTETLPAQEKTR